MTISKNALYRMDLTIDIVRVWSPKKAYQTLERTLSDTFSLMCKDYVFQLERGKKADRPHYQCRISLKKKAKTMVALDNIYDYLMTFDEWNGLKKADIHVTPTQSKTKGFDYVLKEETRERPAVSSKPLDLLTPSDIIAEEDFNDIQQFLYKQWIQDHKLWDPLGRRILFVKDIAGGMGKSEFARTLCYKYPQLYAQLDADQSMDRLVTSVIHAGARKAYFIDLPRASENMASQYSMQTDHEKRIINILRFCEKLKNGNVTSSFYGKYQQLIMSKPIIIVFTNWSINHLGLSPDRVVELDTATFCRPTFWYANNPRKENSAYATLLNKINWDNTEPVFEEDTT